MYFNVNFNVFFFKLVKVYLLVNEIYITFVVSTCKLLSVAELSFSEQSANSSAADTAFPFNLLHTL